MKKQNIFLEIVDSLFIMVLCFGTLLTAMLMKNVSTNLTYTIHINTLLTVILGLVVYLAFTLSHSEKGLKKVIEHIY